MRFMRIQQHRRRCQPSTRVDWSHQLTSAQAKKITVDSVLGGTDSWDTGYDPSYSANRMNIEYGEADGQKLLLDAHVPAAKANIQW